MTITKAQLIAFLANPEIADDCEIWMQPLPLEKTEKSHLFGPGEINNCAEIIVVSTDYDEPQVWLIGGTYNYISG